MSTACKRRLLRDFQKIKSSPPTGISATPKEDNIMQWDAVIFGYVFRFFLFISLFQKNE